MGSITISTPRICSRVLSKGNPRQGAGSRCESACQDGQMFTIPAGTLRQVDGSYNVQTSRRQENPCNPNPCYKVKKSMCEVVYPTTTRCRKLVWNTRKLTQDRTIVVIVVAMMKLWVLTMVLTVIVIIIAIILVHILIYVRDVIIIGVIVTIMICVTIID